MVRGVSESSQLWKENNRATCSAGPIFFEGRAKYAAMPLAAPAPAIMTGTMSPCMSPTNADMVAPTAASSPTIFRDIGFSSIEGDTRIVRPENSARPLFGRAGVPWV